MKISAPALTRLHHTLGALIVSVSASVAQNAPIAPPTAIEPPVIAQAAPPVSPIPGSPVVPAPIEPPIQVPAVPGVPSATGTAGGLPGSTLPGGTALPGTPGVDTVPGTLDMGGARVSEFQGDDLSLVLRTLARQAKMNVVVSTQVTGQITLRVENKTPAEVIRIICQSNGLIIDELDGVYYIKTQAEKQKEPTESLQYTFSYAKAAEAAPLLQGQLSSGIAPQIDVRTNTIFYREGKSNIDKIQRFLESIDAPTKQVMIEARLVEVNANPRQSYGINWGGVVGSSSTPMNFRYGGTDLNPSATNPVGAAQIGGGFQLRDLARTASNVSSISSSVAGQYSILTVQQMSLTLRLLNEDADAEFLANPRVVAANNMKAVIKITRNQPVPQLNFNEQTAQAVFGGFQDKEFGNTLTVTPSINKDSFVSMMVQPEISNKVGDATFTFSGATVASPIIDRRTFDSNVLIRSGDTLAIGGLLQDEVQKARNKVPVLGDVPLFGNLFQERVNSRLKRNLLVFVTPTIIKSGYGTGLEDQISGLKNVGNEFADPNGWRNNAKGAFRAKKTSDVPLAAEYPAPPRSRSASSKYKVSAATRE